MTRFVTGSCTVFSNDVSRLRAWASVAALFFIGIFVVGCGGSSSESAMPLEPIPGEAAAVEPEQASEEPASEGESAPESSDELKPSEEGESTDEIDEAAPSE